jgi:hypothetical protein
MDRKKVLIISLATSVVMVLLILLSRKSSYNDTEIAGGPCTYQEKYHPLIIKNIIPIGNSDSYDMELLNIAFPDEDSIVNYHFLNNYYLDKKQIGILQIGDTITLVEQNISSGSCTPHILSVDIIKFDANAAQTIEE